jgi:hypothetical protein
MHLLSVCFLLLHLPHDNCYCSDQFVPLAADFDQLTLTALFDPCSAIARFSNVFFSLSRATPTKIVREIPLIFFLLSLFIFIFTFAAISFSLSHSCQKLKIASFALFSFFYTLFSAFALLKRNSH